MYCDGILNKPVDDLPKSTRYVYKTNEMVKPRFTSLFLSLTILLSTERVLLFFGVV